MAEKNSQSESHLVPVGPLAPGQRWSLARKREVALRLLRGESLDALSRELGVEVYRLDLGYPHIRHSWEYDGEQYHLGLAAESVDRQRRAEIERRWGWTVVGLGKNLVLGPSMALERGVAEVLGVEPLLKRRLW